MRQKSFEQTIDISLSSEEWITANSFWMKALAWVCILFSTYLSITSYLTRQGHVVPGFVFFVLLGILLLLLIGKLHVNGEKIIYTTPLGNYQMRWDEVHKVEIDFSGGALVFYGKEKNKRMAVLGPQYWGRNNRQRMWKHLHDEMGQREIPFEQTVRARYAMSKNTRIK